MSVVLIVAIAVGYVARTAELGRARDLRLTNAAEVAASELAAVVDTVSVAAEVGRVPALVAEALVEIFPGHDVCVVGQAATSCAGDPSLAGEGIVSDHERERRDTERPVAHHDAQVTVADRGVTIDADGPFVSVVVAVPVPSDATTFPTTYLPASAAGADFYDAGNIRQTASAVPGATGVYVVATAERDVALPEAEYRFYLIVFVLAVVLLVLAGITLFVEQRSLVERASFDPLTKLPNRGEFERCVADVVTHADPAEGACLLLFDLDGFKQINDTHGHLVGDEVLKVVAQRLRSAARGGDVIGRWGGDEFVVLLPGITDRDVASRRARQLADDVSGRTRVPGAPDSLRVKASVGVALWPLHGADLDELVVAADRAMYEAKRNGTTSHVADVVEPTPAPADLVGV